MNDRPEREDGEIERLRAEAADLRGRNDRLEGERAPTGGWCGCPNCLRHPYWPGWPWFIHPLTGMLIGMLSIATMLLTTVAFY